MGSKTLPYECHFWYIACLKFMVCKDCEYYDRSHFFRKILDVFQVDKSDIRSVEFRKRPFYKFKRCANFQQRMVDDAKNENFHL